MRKWLLAVLAVLAGLIVGSAVNMGVVVLGHLIVPLPEGVDFSDPEAAKDAVGRLGARHYLPPLMAHALGTLTGAFVAALIVGPGMEMPSWVVGGCFLLGGISMAFMIPAPIWFLVLDLGGAYLPMALIGRRLAVRARGHRGDPPVAES